jgi:hypothetical protein
LRKPTLCYWHALINFEEMLSVTIKNPKCLYSTGPWAMACQVTKIYRIRISCEAKLKVAFFKKRTMFKKFNSRKLQL